MLLREFTVRSDLGLYLEIKHCVVRVKSDSGSGTYTDSFFLLLK